MQDKKPETTKTSKKYLAFYIIGLFSVALVLILLSYVTQLRADKQLANLNSELAQKDTTVQDVQQEMTDLQDTVAKQEQTIDEQNELIAGISEMLDSSEDEDLESVLQQYLDERGAYYHLAMLEKAIDEDDEQVKQQELKYLNDTYGLDRLTGKAENAVFTGDMAVRFEKLALK